MSKFKELLQASYKSKDTEENIDVYFNRPIGLLFALLWNKLGIHPNVITILSFFLGAGAGWMFYYTDLKHNLLGVLLLVLADFCDSTDGQMARLSGKENACGACPRRRLRRCLVLRHLCGAESATDESEYSWYRLALGTPHLGTCYHSGSFLPFSSELFE